MTVGNGRSVKSPKSGAIRLVPQPPLLETSRAACGAPGACPQRSLAGLYGQNQNIRLPHASNTGGKVALSGIFCKLSIVIPKKHNRKSSGRRSVTADFCVITRLPIPNSSTAYASTFVMYSAKSETDSVVVDISTLRPSGISSSRSGARFEKLMPCVRAIPAAPIHAPAAIHSGSPNSAGSGRCSRSLCSCTVTDSGLPSPASAASYCAGTAIKTVRYGRCGGRKREAWWRSKRYVVVVKTGGFRCRRRLPWRRICRCRVTVALLRYELDIRDGADELRGP